MAGWQKIPKVWGLQRNTQIGSKEVNWVVMRRMDDEGKMKIQGYLRRLAATSLAFWKF